MDWSEIVDNPYLQDLPFKIEQDRYGNILMSPASNRHGRTPSRDRLPAPERSSRVASRLPSVRSQTSEGVKVARRGVGGIRVHWRPIGD